MSDFSDGAACTQTKNSSDDVVAQYGSSAAGGDPLIMAVNPGSMLGSKMVKEAFGMAGGDIRIGAEVLNRAALSKGFESASGRYFDNVSGPFASPHLDGPDPQKSEKVLLFIEAVWLK